MKDISFFKEGDKFVFHFFFKNCAQILMSLTGGAFILIFTLFYLIKPHLKMNDEGFFLVVFFVASFTALKLYNNYKWLASRKRLEITKDELVYSQAGVPTAKMATNKLKEVTKSDEKFLFFPVSAITIKSDNESIKIVGFKSGTDLDQTYDKIKEIISQKNQV